MKTEHESKPVPMLLNMKQLQEQLGIGRRTAYKLVHRSDFPSVKIGREYRVLADELRDWVTSQGGKR